jgi:dTMP kinase
MSLFYATDFADRLENQIIPALKSGFYVLSDRYFFSTMARDIVRGADPAWVRKLYGFAIKPDIVFYLRADLPHVVSRMVNGRGFDYWESGMDIRCADNLYDSFVKYQGYLIQQFDRMAQESGFITIDANRSIQETHTDIKKNLKAFINRHSK